MRAVCSPVGWQECGVPGPASVAAGFGSGVWVGLPGPLCSAPRGRLRDLDRVAGIARTLPSGVFFPGLGRLRARPEFLGPRWLTPRLDATVPVPPYAQQMVDSPGRPKDLHPRCAGEEGCRANERPPARWAERWVLRRAFVPTTHPGPGPDVHCGRWAAGEPHRSELPLEHLRHSRPGRGDDWRSRAPTGSNRGSRFPRRRSWEQHELPPARGRRGSRGGRLWHRCARRSPGPAE